MNRPTKDLSDQELIEIFRAERDNEMVGDLFKRYTSFAFAVSMKFLKDEEDSRDAVMQVFEDLFTLLLKHDVLNFKSWLFMVIKNHCLKILAKRSKEREGSEQWQKSESSIMENNPFSYLIQTMEKEKQYLKLEKVLPRLPEEQRLCIELFYLRDKSYKEIADSHGYTMLQVKSYIQNGKRNLKNLLLTEDETENA